MISASTIDRDTTRDDLLALRQALGIVGFTLVLRDGVFLATSTSVPAHARITPDDIVAVGAGIEAADAVRRSVEKFAARAHERGWRKAS